MKNQIKTHFLLEEITLIYRNNSVDLLISVFFRERPVSLSDAPCLPFCSQDIKCFGIRVIKGWTNDISGSRASGRGTKLWGVGAEAEPLVRRGVLPLKLIAFSHFRD